MDKMNLTMLTDFYELTMANGYLQNGLKDKQAYFDMFFRKVPDNGGFAIMAGVEQLIQYLKNLKFDDKDIEYLRTRVYSVMNSCNILKTLSSTVMFGLYLKELQYFLMNL